MYRTVLVPLDGSAFAEHALPTALGIVARSRDATLHLAMVHVPLAGVHADAIPDYMVDWDRRARERELEYLAALGEEVAGRGMDASTVLLEDSVPEALVRYAEERRVDLIVMTTHGRGGLSRAWLGSVADALVRNAPAPLLLLRPEEAQAPREERELFRHVLIPLDGSRLSERVVGRVTPLLSPTDARVTLLRVVPASLEVGGHVFHLDEARLEEARAHARDELRRVASELEGDGVSVDVEVVTHPSAAVAIVDRADAHDVELIAMATHGRGGLSRMVLGSVTDKVLRSTTRPVLVHRPERE